MKNVFYPEIQCLLDNRTWKVSDFGFKISDLEYKVFIVEVYKVNFFSGSG